MENKVKNEAEKQIVEKKNEVVSISVNTDYPSVLKKRTELINQSRKILTDFIKKNLKDGVDYGTIEIVSKKTGKKYSSKPTLFKAGSEKFISLFNLKPVFERDNDTWEMAGRKVGLFCYVCYLMNPAGEVVGEGRGACDVSEKNNVNEAIKLAEKRAQMDAILRTGRLSDFFTQDLEDYANSQVIENEKGEIKKEGKENKKMITPAQKNLIRRLIEEKTIDENLEIDSLSMKQASDLISEALKIKSRLNENNQG